MYQPTSLETEMEIRRLCADFIGGPWSSAEAKEVTIERLGGFVNRNFAVTLKSDANNIAEQNGVPVKVMVHLYGNELIDSETGFKLNGEAAEAVIVNQLSKLGLAPNILGIFPGGRIETFIPGRILSLNDLNNPNLMNEMGQKLARIHSLCIPIRKAPDRLEGLLQNVQNRSVLVEFGNASEEHNVHYNNFLNFPLEKEMRQISALLSKIGGKPVFIHGDFSMNNIILCDEVSTGEPKLMFVDFELSSFYYRSYDFAYPFKYLELATARNTENQMNEMEVDNNNVELLKEIMIISYLREWKVLNNNDGQTYELCEVDKVEHIKMEVDIARLALDLVKLCYMRFKKIIIRDPETFEGKSEACKQETKITAMMGKLDSIKVAYLFSGQNVWTMDIKEAKLLRVDKIDDIFKNVTGVIESAAKSIYERKYYLLKTNEGFYYYPDSDTTERYTYEEFMRKFTTMFGLDFIPILIGCGAAYKVEPNKSESTIISIHGQSFHCYRNAWEKDDTPSERPCESLKDAVYSPNGIDSERLKGCQGLIIDDGLMPIDDFSSNSLDKRKKGDKDRYRMLFADSKALRYWEGDDLKYDIELSALFGCHSSLIYYAVGAVILGFLLAITIGGSVIFICVMKTKHQIMLDKKNDETTTKD